MKLDTDNELMQRERERVPIVDGTKQGYAWAYDGDGIDLGTLRGNHRGTVQRGLSHTIKSGIDCGVILIKEIYDITGQNRYDVQTVQQHKEEKDKERAV